MNYQLLKIIISKISTKLLLMNIFFDLIQLFWYKYLSLVLVLIFKRQHMGNQQIRKQAEVCDKQLQDQVKDQINDNADMQQIGGDNQTQQEQNQDAQNPYLFFKRKRIKSEDLQKLILQMSSDNYHAQKSQYGEDRKSHQEMIEITSPIKIQQRINQQLQTPNISKMHEKPKQQNEQKKVWKNEDLSNQNQKNKQFVPKENFNQMRSEIIKSKELNIESQQNQNNQQSQMQEEQSQNFQTISKGVDPSEAIEQYNFVGDYTQNREIRQEKQIMVFGQKETISKFSNQKGKTIELQEGNTVATQKGFYYDNQKLVLTQPLKSKYAQCLFRIDELKYCVGIGLAFKQIIQRHDYNYKSEGNELGHGLYIVTTQGYSWSHAQKEEDDIFHPQFKTLYPGAVVTVTLEGETLNFKWKKGQFSCSVRSQLTKKYELAFCAYLHEKGDGVSIIQN